VEYKLWTGIKRLLQHAGRNEYSEKFFASFVKGQGFFDQMTDYQLLQEGCCCLLLRLCRRINFVLPTFVAPDIYNIRVL